MATNGAGSTPDTSNVSTTGSNSNLGKDEVAWYFVEQYYTTLSKSPEKLHLFYSKRSQLVYGKEAEVSTVSVGRQEIQERIKSLDFKEDTKVRISNVDSQTSFDNIVIQVIGESSNKTGEDPKKFVQTFVLAQQPSGYFVLNDILRYVDDGAVEEEQAEEPVAAEEAPAEQSTSAAPETTEETAEPVAPEPAAEEPAPASSLDPAAVDQKLEEVSASGKDASVNGDAAADQSAAAAPAAETAEKAEASKPDPEALAKEVEAETTQEPEKPTDPSPTPVATRQAAPPPAAAAPPKPAQPAQPPKPMTWAGRIAAAAAANAPKPALPKAAAPAAAAAPAQPRPAAQAAAPAAQAAATTPAPAQTSEPAAAKESTEWQTAGGDNKRARPQSISAPRAEKEGTLGYVKYVTEKVESEDLRAALAAHGELVYFDINRQKSCAFVEFANPAGYNAAAAANPHVVNGESIVVEPRRPKASAYGGANYSNTGRGNAANRGGRGGMDGGRAGGQGRGNFGGQNRGRGGMPRGGARGASQAANA